MGRHAVLDKGFTEKYLHSLKPKEREYMIREGRGFTIRVRPTGFKTFLYCYTLNGKDKYENLGSYPATSLAEAREKYHIAYTKVQRGEPLFVMLEAPEQQTPCSTFLEFSELYMQTSRSTHTPEWSAILQSALNNDILPVFKDRSITSITRREVIALLEHVAKRAPGLCSTVQRALSGVMQYAINRDYLEYNPCTRLAKVIPELKPTRRTRVLSDVEIQHVWNSLSKSFHSSPTPRVLKCILFTAQRPGEVAGMHRNEIQGNWWTIPAERAEKGQGAHRVWLTQTVLDLIGDAQGKIFDLRRLSLSQFVNVGHNYFDLPRWTPHDLRRTARTLMARAGVLDEHAEAVLAHKKPGITAVYNQYNYQDEKKAALITLEQELLRIIS